MFLEVVILTIFSTVVGNIKEISTNLDIKVHGSPQSRSRPDKRADTFRKRVKINFRKVKKKNRSK